MTYQASFASGRHLAAARTMAGLKQTELAALAGLHVNSVKRLERMTYLNGSEHAVRCIGDALQKKGVLAERWPTANVRIPSPA